MATSIPPRPLTPPTCWRSSASTSAEADINYYERHIGDYLKDTAHLSLLEHGVYTRLMDVYYTREGAIPAKEVARLIGARSKDEREALQLVLAEFFILVDDAHRQERCEREIERYQDKQRKASASANARWSKGQTHTERNANASPDAMRTHSEGNAPRARPQTPDTRHQYSEANASGAAAPPAPPPKAEAPTPQERIFALGLPLLTAAGVPERNARSMLGLMRKTHGDEPVADAIDRMAQAQPSEPVAWLQAALKAKPTREGSGKPSTGKVDIFAGLEQ